MVPKKHASKRMTCAKRYKITKRAAEKHRKDRKNAPSGIKKSKKDPGIPNLWPFKEKLLNQIEESKVQAEEDKRRRRAENKQQAKAKSLEALAKSAASRTASFEAANIPLEGHGSGARAVSESAITTKDNSRRAYYKEFRKVVDAADVLLEVLDARDPLGCRAKAIERFILDSGATKRIILILNKIDLVPREVVESWLKYLRNEFPAVAFKASTQSQRRHLGHSTLSANVASESALSTSECVGAEALVGLLKNYSRNSGLKTTIRVGVIGYPNVGKSSVINSLRRTRVCQVGGMPGVTKQAQEIHLDKGLRLIDCPGIVFSPEKEDSNSVEVLLRNCVKVELLDDPVAPVDLVVQRCDRAQLMTIYSLPFFSTTQEFLLLLAQSRGKLKRGGIPDIEAAARSVLVDWNSGRIPFYTLPPTPSSSSSLSTAQSASRELVQGWAKEFVLDDVISKEGQVLDQVEWASSTALALPADERAGDGGDMSMLMEGDAMEEEEEDDENEVPMALPMDETEEQPSIQLRLSKSSGKSATTATVKERADPALSLHNALNPQTNKALAQQRKKAAKKARRQTAGLNSSESYDFKEHFGGDRGGDDDDAMEED